MIYSQNILHKIKKKIKDVNTVFNALGTEKFNNKLKKVHHDQRISSTHKISWKLVLLNWKKPGTNT
jgi:hypothetical protein